MPFKKWVPGSMEVDEYLVFYMLEDKEYSMRVLAESEDEAIEKVKAQYEEKIIITEVE